MWKRIFPESCPVSLLRMTPTLFVMGVIFFLSHTPGNAFDLPAISGLDKIYHFLVYALLAASLLWMIPCRCSFPWRTIFFVVLFAMFYGCLDEIHQSFIPLRSPDLYDIVADGCGALSCCLLWRFLFARFEKRCRISLR